MTPTKSSLLKKAVFLDRDGTLNYDPGYLNNPNSLELLNGAKQALALLKAQGFLLVVVTNQSGIARGFISLEILNTIHNRMNELLNPYCIDYFTFCPHHPDDQCKCRKPKPQLILDSAAALNIDLSQSYMIGDRISDVQAGQAADCKMCILLDTLDKRQPDDTYWIYPNLLEASYRVIENQK